MPISGLPALNTNAPIGDDVQPGVDADDFYENQSITNEQIAALTDLYQSQLNIGLAGAGIEGEGLEYKKARGMMEIDRQEEEGRQGAINNALQRGIYRSGIRVENEQEISELASIARMDLQQGITLGLMDLSNRVAQLNNDFALNLTQGVAQLTQEDLGWYGQMIQSGGGIMGDNASGFNTNPANVSAARSGMGAYGARATAASQIAQSIASMFPALGSAGQWRDLGTRPAGGSANSDHYTGGALDIGVDPNNQMQFAQAQQLVTSVLPQLKAAGVVSGWIWHPDQPNDPHGDHIHISFALPGGGANVQTTAVTGLSGPQVPVTTLNAQPSTTLFGSNSTTSQPSGVTRY